MNSTLLVKYSMVKHSSQFVVGSRLLARKDDVCQSTQPNIQVKRLLFFRVSDFATFFGFEKKKDEKLETLLREVSRFDYFPE